MWNSFIVLVFFSFLCLLYFPYTFLYTFVFFFICFSYLLIKKSFIFSLLIILVYLLIPSLLPTDVLQDKKAQTTQSSNHLADSQNVTPYGQPGPRQLLAVDVHIPSLIDSGLAMSQPERDYSMNFCHSHENRYTMLSVLS